MSKADRDKAIVTVTTNPITQIFDKILDLELSNFDLGIEPVRNVNAILESFRCIRYCVRRIPQPLDISRLTIS